jgi:hypothetical protein
MRDAADETRKLYGDSKDPMIASMAKRLAAGLDAFADSIEAHGGRFNPAIFDGGMDKITNATIALGDYCPS